jgi:hypothetical protein
VLSRWRDRRNRREAEWRAHVDGARRRAFAILERIAKPLEASGAATLRRVDGDGLVLRPTDPSAAAVGLYPEPHLHALLVGPEGNLHEVLIRPDGGWRDELEACLRAVVDGGYVEEISGDGHRLTMTFRVPGGEDVRSRLVGDGGEYFGPPGVHGYGPYATPPA